MLGFNLGIGGLVFSSLRILGFQIERMVIDVRFTGLIFVYCHMQCT